MKDIVFSQKDVVIESIEHCYTGFLKMEKFHLKHRLFLGGWSETLSRELFIRPVVAAAIPYDPYRDEILLIEQFRIGAVQQSSPWLLEFVAGVGNNNEERPEDIIHREIQEEAGVTALELKKIYEYWVSPGGSNEYLTLYCAKVDTSLAGGVHGLKQEHEDIFVHVVKTSEAFDLLASDKLNNSLTIIGMQWLQLNKAQLDEEWKK
jgi:ADP-ribose pyrophosphatase